MKTIDYDYDLAICLSLSSIGWGKNIAPDTATHTITTNDKTEDKYYLFLDWRNKSVCSARNIDNDTSTFAEPDIWHLTNA